MDKGSTSLFGLLRELTSCFAAICDIGDSGKMRDSECALKVSELSGLEGIAIFLIPTY